MPAWAFLLGVMRAPVAPMPRMQLHLLELSALLLLLVVPAMAWVAFLGAALAPAGAQACLLVVHHHLLHMLLLREHWAGNPCPSYSMVSRSFRVAQGLLR